MNINSNVPFVAAAQLAKWSGETWSFQWESSRTLTKLSGSINVSRLIEYISSLRIHRDYLELKSRMVTGAVSEGWRDLNVSGPLFQEALWSVMQNYPTNWTPVEYLMEYAINCKLKFPGQQNYDLGRALRNLPSFLREYFIHSLLIERGIVTSIPSPLDNANEHSDLYLTVERGPIGLWSFQSTNKGFAMLHRKVKVRATSFADINFICPFRTNVDAENNYDWFIPSERYIDSIIQFTQKFKLSTAEELESWMLASGAGQPYLMVSGEEMRKLGRV